MFLRLFFCQLLLLFSFPIFSGEVSRTLFYCMSIVLCVGAPFFVFFLLKYISEIIQTPNKFSTTSAACSAIVTMCFRIDFSWILHERSLHFGIIVFSFGIFAAPASASNFSIHFLIYWLPPLPPTLWVDGWVDGCIDDLEAVKAVKAVKAPKPGP